MDILERSIHQKLRTLCDEIHKKMNLLDGVGTVT